MVERRCDMKIVTVFLSRSARRTGTGPLKSGVPLSRRDGHRPPVLERLDREWEGGVGESDGGIKNRKIE